MKLVFTQEQEQVITAAKQNILVSAAAGSGKTAVLTERIVRRIKEGRLDVSQVLVVTFTEAAAHNMRARLEARLRQAREESSTAQEQQRLSRQLALLPTAAISTIHAFCLQVIRDFYHLALDEKGQPLVEPGFVVQDQVEADLLLRQLIDELLDEFYTKIDQSKLDPDLTAAFYQLVDGYGDSRTDQPLRELLRQTFYYLRSLPDYLDFVQGRLAKAQEAAQDFSSSLHCQALIDQLRLRLDRAATVLPRLEKLLAEQVVFLKDKKRNQELRAEMAAGLALLAGLADYLDQAEVSWDEIYRQGQALADFKMPRASKADSAEKEEFLTLLAENLAEAICCLSGNLGTDRFRRHFLFATEHIFNKSAAMIEEEVASMLPALTCFIKLLTELDKNYARQKSHLAVLDFADFEHLALAILRQIQANDYYRQRFKEVYIDEYQDTSSIQESILEAVSSANCLMVGDIKQSIYRFRHARPEIFSHKALAYQTGSDGRLLELNKNFRSVPGILAAVNDMFAQLMSRSGAEIDYDIHQALLPVRPDLPTSAVELVLLAKNEIASDDQSREAEETQGLLISQPDWQDLAVYEKEAQAVVLKLSQLHEEGRAWQDMVILARTRRIVNAYREQLDLAGIPVWADSGSQALDSPQVQLLESMLHVLDNWRQDIPLAAVMHAGIGPVSFDIEKLAVIRLFGKNQQLEFFHEAALAYCQSGPQAGLKSDLLLFFTWLEDLRSQEQLLPLGELIGLILTENGWLDRVAAGPAGGYQVRLLRQFQAGAEEYERNRQKGLFRFVRYLESRRQLDLADNFLPDPAANDQAVRIMTIHGSKGLEFPVVFLVGLGSRITLRDNKAPILFSENLGLGFDYVDPEKRIRYPTHLKLAMLDDSIRANLAEEMRLFYVGMTRAQDQLYLVAALDLDPEKGNKRLAFLLDQARREKSRRLPDHLVRSARSYLEWLVMALARNRALVLDFLQEDQSWANGAASPPATSPPAAGPAAAVPGLDEHFRGWQLKIIQQADLVRTGLGQPDLPSQPELVRARPDWEQILSPYRHAGAARLPLKMTVSELKERQMPPDEDFEQDRLRGIDLTLQLPEEPGELLEGGGASLGTALHLVFRYLDLLAARETADLTHLAGQLEKMRRAGMLTPAEHAAVQPFISQLLAYVISPAAAELAAVMQNNPAAVHLEMPFTLALPARDVYGQKSDLAEQDQVMVQGIIDCWYEKDGALTLLDYKSDLIRGSRAQLTRVLTERYQTQLGWYKKALQDLTGLPVKSTAIWHIRRAELVPIETL